ncbi:hypothetical protein VTJ04DRAFT_215 [Mycothermus thermophilus]|uniref:uncharacterized protein n=1 Tax=Humicola insolens TaxID=85995 RepID=UPI003744B07F
MEEGSPPRPGPGPDTTGPKLIRPIPRRPFALSLSSPTPPDDDSECGSPRPQITANDLRFLAHHQRAAATPAAEHSGPGSTSLSHTTSYLNLTSGTLFGIYSPSTLGSFMTREGDNDDDQYPYDAGTPGDFAPSPRPDHGFGGYDEDAVEDDEYDEDDEEDEEEDNVMTAGGNALSQTSLFSHRPVRRRELVGQLALRAALLFALGMGYGALVTRLPTRGSQGLQRLAGGAGSANASATTNDHTTNWRYLIFWGFAGMTLGTLLPWFDRVWEHRFAKVAAPAAAAEKVRLSKPSENPKSKRLRQRRFSRVSTTSVATSASERPSPSSSATTPNADWSLVIRGVGAFIGIVFAIRKLPWASTMQISLTLALVNPFLWYLIDRSKPGFVLSATIGVVGSMILTGVDPGVMPAPMITADGELGIGGDGGRNWTGAMGGGHGRGGHMSGLAYQEIIETSIWMLSVLFCSCVCFGNVGRRLALDYSSTTNAAAAGRGWLGGVWS